MYAQLIGPVQQLWAIRRKEKELNSKLASLRLTRELMENQIQFQNHFINYVLEPIQNGYSNGYHDESEGGNCLPILPEFKKYLFLKNYLGGQKKYFFKRRASYHFKA